MSATTATNQSDTSPARKRFRPDAIGIYLMIAGLALLPGVLVRLGVNSTGVATVDAALADLSRHLGDIGFGSGLRFWLGVSGAAMMAFLLLYPFRKMLPIAAALGSIGAWFHLHMILGIFGPVLVLYHCDFGHGGSNANVALWTMLAVTGSGILGHFVHTSASAGFYSGRRQAREQLDTIAASLAGLNCLHPSRRHLLDELEALDAALLTPRQGIAPGLRARWRLERSRRRLGQQLSWHITQAAQLLQLDRAEHDRLRRHLASGFASYIRLARRASTRSIREQAWSVWRLFHLPVFLIMLIAIGLHVRAVWGIDDLPPPGGIVKQRDVKVVLVPAVGASSPRLEPSAERRERQEASAPRAGERSPAASQPTGRTMRDLISEIITEEGNTAARPEVVAKPMAAPTRVFAPAEAFDDAPAAPGIASGRSLAVNAAMPVLLSPPRRAQRPSSIVRRTDIAASPSEFIGQAAAAAPRPEAGATAANRKLPPAPAAITAAVPSDSSKNAPSSDALYAQLEALAAKAPAPGGGAGSLTRQVADFKARVTAGKFFHNLQETGFALTGKHTRVECVVCHTQPLREAASDKPRQCVACHKSDDVHRGRRPNCAKCHNTQRWSETR